jgi:hypothetical protein
MEAIADIIYAAPIAIIAHNRFSKGVADEDAVFTFANKVRYCHAAFRVEIS